jgi:hypothetical protein
MRRLYSVVPALLALCSCVAQIDGPVDAPINDPEMSFAITVGVDLPDGAGARRSSYAADDLNRITDLNVFVYHNGELLKDCCLYFTDMSSLLMSLPYEKDGFNIYMVGNMGRIEPPAAEGELGSLVYVVKSYDDFRIKGFPLAEKFIGYKKGDYAHFGLKRLIGQYDIKMRVSADRAEYRVKDVRLKNCAKDVYPFGSGTKASVFVQGQDGDKSGDILTDEDLDKLNAGEAVSLYVVENLQGILLPDNTDRKNKIPSSLELVGKGVADRCTYIEITADIVTPAAKYSDGKYRFYLGQDELKDFSICRNTLYDVTLDFAQNMVCEEEWRIEVGEPQVVDVVFSKVSAVVAPYAKDTIYVYSNTCNIDEVIDLQTASMPDNYYNKITGSRRFVTTYKGRRAYAFEIYSMAEFKGLYPYGITPQPMVKSGYIKSRETYNGNPLISQQIEISHYDKAFPLLLKLEKQPGNSSYSIVLRGYNPFGWNISLCSDYVYGEKSSSTGWRTVERLSESPSYMGIMASGVRPDNLSRIDFHVKLGREDIYMGAKCSATYGPGAEMYPEKFADLQDDAPCDFIYYDRSISNWFPLIDSEIVYNGYLPLRVEGLPGNVFFRNNYPSSDISTDPGNGINSRYYDKVIPFYFVNGCLQCYRTELSAKPMVNYPDKRWRGTCVYMYGPGRDLFYENRNGKVIDVNHRMGYWITTWKNLLQKIKTEQESQYYEGQLYMTINGSSCWIGGDESQYGYFTDSY